MTTTSKGLIEQAQKLEATAAQLRTAAGSVSASTDVSAEAAFASLPTSAMNLKHVMRKHGLHTELSERGGIGWTRLERVMAEAAVPPVDAIFIKQGLGHFGRLRAA